jgi:hypothetical protein
MSHYEATVKVAHISTSPAARNPLSVADATARATANLDYITRRAACQDGDLLIHQAGKTEIAQDEKGRAALRARALSALDERGKKHRANTGVRLCDKLIVSLPADATPAEHRQMATEIIASLGGDSEALLIGAIHTDKQGNPHLHIWALDGLETVEAAKARAPNAKRVRRAEHLQMNEGGNRQELRAQVAEAINKVSRTAGRRLAEVRSFKERGIDRTPQKHEGVQVADKLERETGRKLTPRVQKRLTHNLDILWGSVSPYGITALEHLPERWKKRPVFKAAFEERLAASLKAATPPRPGLLKRLWDWRKAPGKAAKAAEKGKGGHAVPVVILAPKKAEAAPIAAPIAPTPAPKIWTLDEERAAQAARQKSLEAILARTASNKDFWKRDNPGPKAQNRTNKHDRGR